MAEKVKRPDPEPEPEEKEGDASPLPASPELDAYMEAQRAKGEVPS